MIAHARSRRSGLTIIAVMLTLSVLVILGSVVLRATALRRGVARGLEHRMQAQWLAESALERARARLAADPAYKGETWTLTPADLGRPATNTATPAAQVAITIEQANDGTAAIAAVADLPIELPDRTRITKRTRITLKTHTGASR